MTGLDYLIFTVLVTVALFIDGVIVKWGKNK